MKHFCAACLLLFITVKILAQPIYEVRAVWVASVENIDWPSKKGLSAETQKEEFIQLLNLHQRNGMNTVFVQVRPTADAMYASSFEPWSEYLMGKQGAPPSPYYDPLQFMIDETHLRGMEFHAWINPYRAVFHIGKSSVAANHITKQHPNWFLNYGTTKFFNPGLPQVRSFVVGIIKEIVEKYKVDGIHMDDYFYPYRISGKEFPDQKTYIQYGNGLNKEDWRRSNCDSIIFQLHQTIKNTNPRVKFGISPFGVWRNKSTDVRGSDTKAGQTNYDDLYADILLWLQKGWIDYVTPQLYWERGHKLCDYDGLLAWWNNNTFGKHLYIGHGIYRAGTTTSWKDKNELPMQIQQLRNYTTTQGSAYFSSSSFLKNANGWNDSLRNNYYANPALPYPMPWLDSIAPDMPYLQTLNDGINKIAYKGKEAIKGYAIFTIDAIKEPNLTNAKLVQIITQGGTNKIDALKWLNENKRVFVSTIDLNNNISKWIEMK